MPASTGTLASDAELMILTLEFDPAAVSLDCVGSDNVLVPSGILEMEFPVAIWMLLRVAGSKPLGTI